MIGRRFHAVRESGPGPKLAAIFARYWPGYRAFWAREGVDARPSRAECAAALRRHMPELVPVWRALVEAVDGGDEQARFLSLWCPPDFRHGCTQAIWARRPYAILRNYDYPPTMFDAVLLRAGLTGSDTLAMADCVWGVLDGLNRAGLALSLAFGGRDASGPGFGITLVLRYLLETCADVDEALAALRRIPVHLCYNIALLDRSGNHATVEVSPDRGVELRAGTISANRQGGSSWPDSVYLHDTVRREALLAAAMSNPAETADTML
ncbi:MAG TPA: C45 family autoproteolytic acyltransferase/hydrolase, partial [Geminicoccaceae bacterium]|nr:C45 family autoproteolytic acyltransferase/hydrolase [Geminicoccaceae bacterium]